MEKHFIDKDGNVYAKEINRPDGTFAKSKKLDDGTIEIVKGKDGSATEITRAYTDGHTEVTKYHASGYDVTDSIESSGKRTKIFTDPEGKIIDETDCLIGRKKHELDELITEHGKVKTEMASERLRFDSAQAQYDDMKAKFSGSRTRLRDIRDELAYTRNPVDRQLAMKMEDYISQGWSSLDEGKVRIDVDEMNASYRRWKRTREEELETLARIDRSRYSRALDEFETLDRKISKTIKNYSDDVVNGVKAKTELLEIQEKMRKMKQTDLEFDTRTATVKHSIEKLEIKKVEGTSPFKGREKTSYELRRMQKSESTRVSEYYKKARIGGTKPDPIRESRYSVGATKTAAPRSEVASRVSSLARKETADIAKYEYQVSSMAKRLGVSEVEIKHVLDTKISEFVSQGQFGTRKGVSTLEKCLDGGYVKSQFETGMSSGYIGGTVDKYGPRASLEKDLFDLPLGTAYVDRPVYGMVFPKDPSDLADYIRSGPGSWYGSGSDKCVIMFKKEAVLDTTTITLGDSLDYGHDILPTLASDPKFCGAFESFGKRCSSLEELKQAKLTDLFSVADGTDCYVELQFHGQQAHSMTAQNIDVVLFTSRPSDTIIKKLTEKNIPWREV